MTPEQQRIAIAEACGWTNICEEIKPAIIYLWGTDLENCKSIVPDYLNDLNAMHEAEKLLGRGASYGLYKASLAELCAKQHPIDAAAAQRAEAFLRTIGKWQH